MEQANEVRAVSIQIDNVKGIEHAELRLRKPEPGKGQLILLSGDNGVGKTSALAGVECLFSGGHNVRMIRDGADKAEVRMLLSDGTDIKRTITRKGYSLKVMRPDSDKPMPAPESYIKKLASGFGFDPISFCTAKKEDRLKYLLAVMPMEFTAKEVSTAMGAAAKLLEPPAGTLDITGANRLIRDLTEKRAAIGSRRDERASSVESFRKRLLGADQGDTPKDWKAELESLELRKSKIEKDERDEVTEIEAQIKGVRKSCSQAIDAAAEQSRDEFSGLLGRAKAGDDGNLGTMQLGQMLEDLCIAARLLADSEKEAQKAIDDARAANAQELQKLAGEIATAKAGAEEQVRSGAIREEMIKLQKEARALSADWDTVAAAIKNLDDLRTSKLKNLPVDGLEVRDDGGISLHGRDFDDWNQGQCYTYAMAIGSVGVGDLNLMICDEFEHLGPDNRKYFEEAVVESGLTVLAACVASQEEIAQFGPGLRSVPAGALLVEQAA